MTENNDQNLEIHHDRTILAFHGSENNQVTMTLKQTRSKHLYHVTDDFDFNNKQPQNSNDTITLDQEEYWLNLDFTRYNNEIGETTEFDEKDRFNQMRILVDGLIEIFEKIPPNISSNTKVVSWGAMFRFARFLNNSLGFKYITNFNYIPDEYDTPESQYFLIGTLEELESRTLEIKKVLDKKYE